MDVDLRSELDALSDVADRLSECDPWSCADPDTMEQLLRDQSRIDAFVSTAAAAFETSGSWAPSGARSALAWMMAKCRLPRFQAARLLHRGRELRHLPAFARAWRQGAIGGAQIDVVIPVRTPATEAALARDEEMLAEKASMLPYKSFVSLIAYWKQLADPNGAEADDEARRGRRRVYLESSFGGMWLGQMTLDPISGSIVSGELERLEREFFASDWSEAKEALGREPALAELLRSSDQRRADALVEMATRSQMAPVGGRRPGPLFSVLVDYGTLRGRCCELADGTVLAPGALLPWFTDGYLERVVFAPGERCAVSEHARLFTGATRRAIELRDRQCTHPMCDIPADRCQVDHVIPWSQGGPTTEENGRLLCGFHNRLCSPRRKPNGREPPDG